MNNPTATEERPSTQCYLNPAARVPVIDRIVFRLSDKVEKTWIRQHNQGTKQMKAFCIGLLYAKFRSGFDLKNPIWAELACAPGSTWAKTLSENMCLSKRIHAAWWMKEVDELCPKGEFPFNLRNKPDSNRCFRVIYQPNALDDASCWSISRLELFDAPRLQITGRRLLVTARELEKSEDRWIPILPDDDEVNSWRPSLGEGAILPLALSQADLDRHRAIHPSERRFFYDTRAQTLQYTKASASGSGPKASSSGKCPRMRR